MPSSPPSQRDRLLEQISRFPESPGVYIMKNGAGEPIYIGKAVDLRSRVRSYFTDAHETRAQIPFMLDQLATIGFIATLLCPLSASGEGQDEVRVRQKPKQASGN
jgi:hypothetical protein